MQAASHVNYYPFQPSVHWHPKLQSFLPFTSLHHLHMSRLKNRYIFTCCHWWSSFTPALQVRKMIAGTYTYFLSWSQETEFRLFFLAFRYCVSMVLIKGWGGGRGVRAITSWWLHIPQQQRINNWKWIFNFFFFLGPNDQERIKGIGICCTWALLLSSAK